MGEDNGFRQVRVYTRPLGAEDPDSMKGPDFFPLNHWALVVGSPPELLLEVVAEQGRDFWHPLNSLRIAFRGRGLEEKIKFFTAIGPVKGKTNLPNNLIIEIASSIVRKNPIYNFFLRNCQDFVIDLANAIMGHGWSYILRPQLMSAPVTMAWHGATDEQEYQRLVNMLTEMRLLPSKSDVEDVRQVVEKMEVGTKMGGFRGEMYLPELSSQVSVVEASEA
ncbi:hypothetical protein BDV36DRAFT_298854 [Aspergillus pseudocaelatus]|uniref:PPPDE peptidase domain-containing protein n=1 Tax=Aspergillus pseudocaelatus TaxID=1825620 RepID=A0ABQ6WBX0_9EURO|nr:hypothetical protein BDV36DRAFT_298854 [Aspergillus pseudocaelatus]